MKDIDSIRGSVVGDKMLEKAIRHLISLLKVEYDLLIQNRINEVVAVQNKKNGVLKFLDAQSVLLSGLLERGSLHEHIGKARCAEIKELTIELQKNINAVKSVLESKIYINEMMLKAVQEVLAKSSLRNNINYKAKGKHVSGSENQGYMVMSESV